MIRHDEIIIGGADGATDHWVDAAQPTLGGLSCAQLDRAHAERRYRIDAGRDDGAMKTWVLIEAFDLALIATIGHCGFVLVGTACRVSRRRSIETLCGCFLAGRLSRPRVSPH